ncbi:hypothetical protein LSH36_168g04089 [Paralvinella palmiformis]|uniref:L-Fucosyltransferase n=1 Tax=Paralvinella palmiformis TaxID=53620 RepID=A0AAD9JTZ6_9ANNE|nr:hypothetical protein LSH36_168g04089 [Paralvinella palmiformis]
MKYIRLSLISLAIFITLSSVVWLYYSDSLSDTSPLATVLSIKSFISNANDTAPPYFEMHNSSDHSSQGASDDQKPNAHDYVQDELIFTNDTTTNRNASVVLGRATNETDVAIEASGHLEENTTGFINSSLLSSEPRGRESRVNETYLNESETSQFQANQTKLYLTVKFKGRLGNQMLEYAALFALTRRFSTWTPVLVKCGRRFGLLLDAFKDSLSIPRANFSLENGVSFVEDPDADVTVEQLRHLPKKNLTLEGFFQSHKFFENAKYELRKEYTFPRAVQDEVFAYFRNITPPEWKDEEFVRVGIHVRRKSLVSSKRQAMGFIPRPPSYFAHAMSYFSRKYERVQFIVGSDDMGWSKENVKGRNVVYSHHSAPIDLAIFANCDHMIMCLGSYSWWAGWLCRGTTIYYGVMPRNGTYLDRILSNNKWIPPPEDEYNHWLPIT